MTTRSESQISLLYLKQILGISVKLSVRKMWEKSEDFRLINYVAHLKMPEYMLTWKALIPTINVPLATFHMIKAQC